MRQIHIIQRKNKSKLYNARNYAAQNVIDTVLWRNTMMVLHKIFRVNHSNFAIDNGVQKLIAVGLWQRLPHRLNTKEFNNASWVDSYCLKEYHEADSSYCSTERVSCWENDSVYLIRFYYSAISYFDAVTENTDQLFIL